MTPDSYHALLETSFHNSEIVGFTPTPNFTSAVRCRLFLPYLTLLRPRKGYQGTKTRRGVTLFSAYSSVSALGLKFEE